MDRHEQIAEQRAGIESRQKIQQMEREAEEMEREAETLDRQSRNLVAQEGELGREIEEHRVQMELLLAKLETVRAEGVGILERAEAARKEAASLREQAFDYEADIALSRLEDSHPAGWQQLPTPDQPPAVEPAPVPVESQQLSFEIGQERDGIPQPRVNDPTLELQDSSANDSVRQDEDSSLDDRLSLPETGLAPAPDAVSTGRVTSDLDESERPQPATPPEPTNIHSSSGAY